MAKIFNVKSSKQNLFLPILKANRYLSMSGTSKRDSPDINCLGKWNKTHLGRHNNGFSQTNITQEINGNSFEWSSMTLYGFGRRWKMKSESVYWGPFLVWSRVVLQPSKTTFPKLLWLKNFWYYSCLIILTCIFDYLYLYGIIVKQIFTKFVKFYSL